MILLTYLLEYEFQIYDTLVLFGISVCTFKIFELVNILTVLVIRSK